MPGEVRERGVPRVPREGAGGRGQRRQLQRQGAERAQVPVTRHLGPQDLLLLNPCVMISDPCSCLIWRTYPYVFTFTAVEISVLDDAWIY